MQQRITHLSLSLIVVVYLLGSANSGSAQEYDGPDLVERVKPAVVLIVTDTKRKNEVSQGTGFLIRSDLVVSNWHVIEEAKTIIVKTIQGKWVNVKSILSKDSQRDLALLELDSPLEGVLPLKIATSLPREGEYVMVVGNPEGLGWSNSDGRVASIREPKGSPRLLQITAPISHGSSGSPVVNRRGEVVGVAVGMKEGGQNLNFAISSEYISKLYTDSSEVVQFESVPRSPRQVSDGIGLGSDDSEVSPAAAKMSRDFYYQGASSLSKNDYKTALPLFEKAVVVNPKFAEAWFSLAYCKSELGNTNAAIGDYKTTIRLKPDMHDAHWNLAGLYFRNKQYKEAAAAFKEAVGLKPDEAEGYYQLGSSYLYSSQFVEAVSAFKQMLKLKPDSANAYYMIGRAYIDLGKYSDAIESFRRSDLFVPSRPWTIYWWGIALLEQKNYRDAIAKLNEASVLKSDFSEAYNALGLAYYRTQEFDIAVEMYRKAIEFNGDDIQNYQGLSNVYIRLGKKDESVALFRELLAKKPNNADALIMLGAALIQTGKYDEAEQNIEKAYKLNPDDSEARGIIAYNYSLTENYDKAANHYSEAVRLAPKDSYAYSGRAWNYLYARNGLAAAKDALQFLSLEGWRMEHSPYMVLVAYFGYRIARQDQEARKLLLDCGTKCDVTAWPYPITRYLRGEIPATALISSATDNDKMTEAHAYIGMNAATLGQNQDAIKEFDWVIKNGNKDFTEYPLAISEKKYLEGQPKQLPATLPAQKPPMRRRRPAA
jgi:tetratricopeptide (TPR) repeat protein